MRRTHFVSDYETHCALSHMNEPVDFPDNNAHVYNMCFFNAHVSSFITGSSEVIFIENESAEKNI